MKLQLHSFGHHYIGGKGIFRGMGTYLSASDITRIGGNLLHLLTQLLCLGHKQKIL